MDLLALGNLAFFTKVPATFCSRLLCAFLKGFFLSHSIPHKS